MVPIPATLLGILMLASRDFIVDAIRCHVCAPIADFGTSWLDFKDGGSEDCGMTTEFCHVLFVQKGPKGKMEVFRNCGKGKGAFAAGDNECKDFATSDGGTARLCNCMKDDCNIQTINVPQDQVPVQEPQTMPVTVAPLPTTRTQGIQTPTTAKSGADRPFLAFLSTLLLLVGATTFGILNSKLVYRLWWTGNIRQELRKIERTESCWAQLRTVDHCQISPAHCKYGPLSDLFRDTKICFAAWLFYKLIFIVCFVMWSSWKSTGGIMYCGFLFLVLLNTVLIRQCVWN